MDALSIILLMIFFTILYRVMSIAMMIKRDEFIELKVKEGMEKLKETIIPSRIEDIGDMLLLYNTETNEFIAQGKTFEELNKNAKLRFPDKLFNVPQSIINKYASRESSVNA